MLPLQFWQQHIIITGGSSGIGKTTAKLLAGEGAHISIIARTPATLEAAKAEIEVARASREQRVLAIPADVAQRNQITQAIETAVSRVGPPDALITCAAIAHPGYFRALPLEIFEQTMAINYFGTLYSIKAVLPLMEQRRKGHIVLVSSAVGLVGLFGYTPYSPSKFAVRGLAESLRGELKLYNIGLSIVYPPDTDTPQLVEENKTKPIETKLIAAKANKVLSADHVAQAIVNGLKKGVWLITPSMEMGLLARFHSVLLPALNWYFDRLVARIQRAEKES